MLHLSEAVLFYNGVNKSVVTLVFGEFQSPEVFSKACKVCFRIECGTLIMTIIAIVIVITQDAFPHHLLLRILCADRHQGNCSSQLGEY